MANTFKNRVGTAIGTTLTDVYQVPSGSYATLIGLSLANLTEATLFASVKLFDNSQNLGVFIVKSIPIPPNSTIVVVGGDQKIILESLDKIQVQSDQAASVDVILSSLEVSAS